VTPSGFLLSRRQVFGFLVPGALWIAAFMWGAGRQPVEWLGQASLSQLVVFVLGSYLVGYVLQSAVFSPDG